MIFILKTNGETTWRYLWNENNGQAFSCTDGFHLSFWCDQFYIVFGTLHYPLSSCVEWIKPPPSRHPFCLNYEVTHSGTDLKTTNSLKHSYSVVLSWRDLWIYPISNLQHAGIVLDWFWPLMWDFFDEVCDHFLWVSLVGALMIDWIYPSISSSTNLWTKHRRKHGRKFITCHL